MLGKTLGWQRSSHFIFLCSSIHKWPSDKAHLIACLSKLAHHSSVLREAIGQLLGFWLSVVRTYSKKNNNQTKEKEKKTVSNSRDQTMSPQSSAKQCCRTARPYQTMETGGTFGYYNTALGFFCFWISEQSYACNTFFCWGHDIVLAAGAASVCVQDMECVSYRSDKAECLYLSDKW